MQVILQKNVEHLGMVGDLVNVKPGYFRNFLAPRQLAFLANPNNIEQFKHQKEVVEAKKNKLKGDAESLKTQLEANSFTIKHQAGSGERLFGSITAQEITNHIKQAGFTVDRKYVLIDSPIKTLGEHVVEVKLHPDVKAGIKIIVERDEKKAAQKAADKADKEEAKPEASESVKEEQPQPAAEEEQA